MTNIAISRPQPVGILPIPAGLLILPRTAIEHEDALRGCMGEETLLDLPAEWQFYLSAARGHLTSALAQLGGHTSMDAAYNRFVLDPPLGSLLQLRDQLSGGLRMLLEVAAFVSGNEDRVPVAEDLDGELLALVLMTQAKKRPQLPVHGMVSVLIARLANVSLRLPHSWRHFRSRTRTVMHG